MQMDIRPTVNGNTPRSAEVMEQEYTELKKTVNSLVKATNTLPSELAEKIDYLNSQDECEEEKMTTLTDLVELRLTLQKVSTLEEEAGREYVKLERKISSELEEIEENRETIATFMNKLEEKIKTTTKTNRLMELQTELAKCNEITTFMIESDSLKNLLNKLNEPLVVEPDMNANEILDEINKLQKEVWEKCKDDGINSLKELEKEIEELEEEIKNEKKPKKKKDKEEDLDRLLQIKGKYEQIAHLEGKLKDKIKDLTNSIQEILEKEGYKTEIEMLTDYEELKEKPRKNKEKILKCEELIKIKELILKYGENLEPMIEEPVLNIGENPEQVQNNGENLEQVQNNVENPEQVQNNVENPEPVLEEPLLENSEGKCTTIRELYSDTEEMVDCVERSCKRIIMLTLILLLEKNSLKDLEKIQSNITNPEEEFGQEIKNLKNNMVREDLLNSTSNTTLYEKIQVSFANNDFTSIAELTKKILKLIINLDVKTIKRLVNMNKDAGSYLKDADCVCFLGSTGAGKSTTIHYLGGSQMEKFKYKGLDHIGPVRIYNPMLKNVSTNPEARSETRFIIPVRLSYSEIGIPKPGEIILCDMPGYGDTGSKDTSGAEVDIANSYGILNSLALAKSLRLVFPFSSKSIGDRLEGLTEAAHYIVNLVKGDDGNNEVSSHLKSFTYLFTKFPEKFDKNQIYKMIENKREHLQVDEKEDSSFEGLYLDMLEKTENGAIIVNPLDESEKKNIWKKIINRNPIKKPKEVLSFSMTEKTRAKINEHLKKRRMTVISACQHKNFPLIKYVLEELFYLQEITNSEFINKEFEECKNQVKESLKKYYNEGIDKFNKCLSLNNELTEADIKEYSGRIEIAKSADSLRDIFSDNSIISSAAFTQNVHSQILDLTHSLEGIKVSDISYKILLNKVMSLGNFFEGVQTHYLNILSKIENKIGNIILEFINNAKEKKFDECNELLKEYFLIKNIFEHHLDKSAIQNNDGRIKEEFSNILLGMLNKSETSLKKEKLDESDLNNLNENVLIFEKLEDLPYIKSLNADDEFFLKEVLFEKITEYFNKVNCMIIEKLEKKEENSLKTIEPLFEQLQMIRRIHNTSKYTSEKFFETSQLLFGFINNIRRDLEVFACNLFISMDNKNIDKLHSYMVILKEAKWVDKLRKDTVSNIVEKLENDLQENMNSFKNFIVNSPLDIYDIQNLTNLTEKVCFFSKMKIFGEKYKDEIQSVIDWYSSIIESMYLNVENFCNENKIGSFNYAKYEKMYEFLISISKIYFVGLPAVLNKNIVMGKIGLLEEYVSKFSRSVFGSIETSMIKISDLNNIGDDISSDVKNMVNNLYELKLIQSKFPILVNLIDPEGLKIPKTFKEIENFYYDLEEHLKNVYSANAVITFKKGLSLTKSLIGLDETINSTLKFRDLHKEFSEKDRHNIPQNLGELINLINECKFLEIITKMDELNFLKKTDPSYKNQFEILQSRILSKAEDITTKTRTLARKNEIEMNIDDFDEICKHFSHLSSIKENLSCFLIENSLNNITEAMNKIKKNINENLMQNLNRITGIISNCNLVEAEKLFKEMNFICDIFGVHCEERVFEKIKRVKDMQEITIKDIINKYEKMSISDYRINPPKVIFNKLCQDEINNPYSQTLEKIKSIILANYRNEFERIKYSKGTKFQKRNEFKKLETSLVTMPENIHMIIEEEIRTAKIEVEFCLISNELEDKISKKDYKRLKELSQDYRKEGFVDLEGQIEVFVAKEAEDLKCEVENSLKNGDVHLCLKRLKDFYELSNNFEGEIINQAIIDTKSTLDKFFKRMKKILFKFFNLDNASEINQNNLSILNDDSVAQEDSSETETSKEASLAFEVFKGFFNFRKQFNAAMTYFAPSFEKFVPVVFLQIINSLDEIENKTSIYFKNSIPDINLIKAILDIKKRWECNVMHSINQDLGIFQQDYSKLITSIKNSTMYNDLSKKVCKKLLDEFVKDFMKRPLINEKTKGLDKYKKEFYENLNLEISSIKKLNILQSHIKELNFEQITTHCEENLRNKVIDVIKDTDKILAESKLTKTSGEMLSIFYVNINFISEHIPADILVDIKPQEISDNIKNQIMTKVNDISEDVLKKKDVEEIAQMLIDIKTISESVPYFKKEIDEKIDEILLVLKKKSNFLSRLSLCLENDIIGKDIVFQHKAFEDVRNALFNKKTKSHGIDYVMENIRGDEIDKGKLKNKYEEVMATYEKLIRFYLKKDIDYQTLLAELKDLVGNVVQKKNKICYEPSVRNKIPEIIGFIFAIWTLQNSEGYFDLEGEEDNQTYLKQPLAAQVVSILRILGIGDKKEMLQNNLVQIGTGEGKSLTLAVVSSVLALLGFDISCVCYSSILSTRDFNAFNSLFDILGVSQYIYYGTFKGICERMLNKTCNIREKVTEIILGNNSSNSNASANSDNNDRAKILVVDEVDVFFSEDFYGNEYLPSASLKHPLISSFIKLIWKSSKGELNYENLKTSQEFIDLYALFKDYGFVAEEATKQMLMDIKSFDTHTYSVNEDKIAYKDQDEIVFNISYGYQTVFAYLKAYDEKKLTETSLNENLCISLRCGCFSYAEIPHQFSYIFGVTGTLETVTDPEREILEKEYKIHRNTYMPSVFGKNERKFNKFNDLKIETKDDYFNAINKEIESRIMGNIQGTNRAVLVGFENLKDLYEFYNSAFANNKDKAKILTEEANIKEKYSIIQNATCQGQITLFTRAYGRGIDYMIRDDIVNAQGGIHVIQTFLSKELSEEVQIKGRVARQGDPGSYSMILLESSLEAYGIFPADIEKNKAELYEFLNAKRNKFFKDKYINNTKINKSLLDNHSKSEKFREALNEKMQEQIKKFLFDMNNCSSLSNVTCKTIILVDATCSMGGLLMRCICTIGDMFERILAILKSNNIDSKCFEIQFVAYRNYNSKQEDILRVSPLETKPENLKAFMKRVKNDGGWVNEAIEVGLWHANEEMKKNKISQVIIIGDAPANTPEEVTYKRQKEFGENYWKNTKFSTPTTYIEEMNKLIAQNIPIHAFYLMERAKENFTEIAAKSGGRCEFLDIESDKGTDILTAFITEEILRVIGSNSGVGNNLVSEYQTRYAKTYK